MDVGEGLRWVYMSNVPVWLFFGEDVPEYTGESNIFEEWRCDVSVEIAGGERCWSGVVDLVLQG